MNGGNLDGYSSRYWSDRPIHLDPPSRKPETRRVIWICPAFTVHPSLKRCAYLTGTANFCDLPQVIVIRCEEGCHLCLMGSCADSHIPITLQGPFAPCLVHKSGNSLVLHLLYHSLTAVNPWGAAASWRKTCLSAVSRKGSASSLAIV